jgi:hypothetical protein
MRTRSVLALSHALVVTGGCFGTAARLDAQAGASLPPLRREYPLNCRGGAGLTFDTVGVASDSGRVRLALTFAANPTASGPEGQGLEPGTCAWVDRPLSEPELRRIQVTIGTADSTPRQSVRDADVYWGFLAYNSDSGHITGVGYRHWQASSPPLPRPAAVAVAAPAPVTLPWKIGAFDVRYLPLLGLACGALLWAPMVTLIGRWSGWRRLAHHYPNRNTGHGRSFRSGQLVMHMSVYRGGVRLTPDESHLHFATSSFARPGHPPFSVPWSDIDVAYGEWPWFPLKGHPVVRLTLAADRGHRILVPVKDGKRIVAASDGRLSLSEPRAMAVGAH